MVLVVAYAATLLLAVLVSERAHRTILSTAVLFLVAGFLTGRGGLQLGPGLADGRPIVATFAELALFSVLFTDGMRVTVRDLTDAWRLPGRALVLGLPLTLFGTAVLARLLTGLPWSASLLVGAVLSPTDPVFAAAIVGRDEVPYRLRHLLNVESGLNDGLALPVVIVLLEVVGHTTVDVPSVLKEVVVGITLGIALPWAATRLEHSRFFSATPAYAPLYGVAIGLLVLSVASLTSGNAFLAAFAAGITVATVAPGVRRAFHQFGELLTELLKLAALLVFGALISRDVLGGIGAGSIVFAVLAIVVVRPLALAVALRSSGLTWLEWVAAAWFGPKGFASVVYGLLILEADVPDGSAMFSLIALVVALSILAHSSTDVIVARWFTGARSTVPDADHDGAPMNTAQSGEPVVQQVTSEE